MKSSWRMKKKKTLRIKQTYLEKSRDDRFWSELTAEKMCSTREGKKSVVTNASALGVKKSEFSGGKEAGIEQKALMKKPVGTFAEHSCSNM